jgi:phosphoribosylformylglycinamidine synthase II
METPTLPFSEMSDADIRTALRKYSIGLTVDEAKKVQELLGRAPTVVEAVIWGIQGSEHCSYKSSRRFLKMFHTKGKHVILGPGEDSGIIAVTDDEPGKRWGIVVSHESHNHPSQIVPYEGAATGVGGTVRDVVCMGARVIGCMDMLRLGDPKNENAREIATEVFRGIAGYGNPLGVPNLGGDTVFDPAYNDNCLVNAIAIGLVREDQIIHSYAPDEAAEVGYDIILVGKPTDRSGFGGAAFASVSMEEEKKEQNTGAVQEPNPFLERHLLVSTYALFDWLVAEGKLDKVSFKDLGAGGVVCASVEQVAPKGFGAEVDLEKVHVSLPGLPPEVISCAETQERFCWVCHPSLTEAILKHYNVAWDLPSVAENARASVIGKVTGDGIYRLRYKGKIVCEAKSQDITSGLQYVRPTEENEMKRAEPQISCAGADILLQTGGKEFRTTVSDVFTAMIGHPNHASKSPVIRHYDKTVIGNGVIEAGEADAGVIRPLRDGQSYLPGAHNPAWAESQAYENLGIAFAADGNPRYGRISAYAQGLNAAAEAICNVAAVGAEPRALTDCLNYGNPEIPSQLSALEQGVRGISDAAKGLGEDGEPVPVISGNVSLYNGTPDGSAIPPSAIVCAIGVLPDASKAVDMRLKNDGSALILIGARKAECGGSAYYEILESLSGAERDSLLGANVPLPNFAELSGAIRTVRAAIDARLATASHDISDGGMLLALFEMLLPQRKIGGGFGVSVDLDALGSDLPTDTLLFTQTEGFILEVAAGKAEQVLELARTNGAQAFRMGETTADAHLRVRRDGKHVTDLDALLLRGIWEEGLTTALAGE